MENKYINKIRHNDLIEFISILKTLQFEFNINDFINIVNNTIKYLNGDKNKRIELRLIQELENKWYKSLDNNTPDFNIYDDIYYLADCWVCWKKYSREYIKSIISDKSMAIKSPDGFFNFKSIKDDIGSINTIIDLGCGIGYSTAALREEFNCKVIGTNIKNTKQYQVCEIISNKTGFIISDSIDKIQSCDMIFASEYFEHFERPVEHLIYIIETLKPKIILFANTFNAQSIGHFNIYKHNNYQYTGGGISRLFINTLKIYNFNRIKTNCWNNRPNYFRYEE